MFSIVKNYLKENTGILIRIDDVCENMDWNKMRHLESLFDKYSIKPVIGVIPNNKDDFFLTIREMKIFGSKLENGIKWDGRLQCTGTRIFMTDFVKKADYFNYGGGSEFLVIQ